MKKLILFNGPPRSGKDTVGGHLQYHLLNKTTIDSDLIYQFKFATPLKQAANIFLNDYSHSIYTFEDVKDEPQPILNGGTYRELLIRISENAVKTFGKDVFGNMAFARMRENLSNDGYSELCGVHICTDSGFEEECQPLIEAFGEENTLLVRLHREGCDFSSDSRSHLDIANILTLDIHNNFDFNMIEEVSKIIKEWIYDGSFSGAIEDTISRCPEYRGSIIGSLRCD